MQLISLETENFKKLGTASFSFTGGLNAVVGDNAQGKSTLLRAVALSLYGASVLPGKSVELTKETLFVEVAGRGERSEVAEYIQQVWEQYPNLLAVRNNCSYVENGEVVEDVDLSDLHTVITKGLNDEKQLALYNQLREELCN